MAIISTDVLIIGCGIAGATAALQLAKNPAYSITIVTREFDATESNTRYAQGGIVSRNMLSDDDVELLVHDIISAGAGATSPLAARILAEEGPALLDEMLIRSGAVHFDSSSSGELDWGQEAAHSRRRILHVGDATGSAIIKGLHRLLAQYANVRILCDATAVDLITFPHHSRDPLDAYQPITCHGAYVLHTHDNTVSTIVAGQTILATGGIGQVYRFTTNPAGARGDGLAMAKRAGAHIVNMEYVQFHPTSLAVPGANGFLISEAVRGEGALLKNFHGERFMARYAPEYMELAPRDVVARAIHSEMERTDTDFVYLDLHSVMDPEKIPERFPTIYATCLRYGVDITKESIPVTPAAHYACGGIRTDADGLTDIARLYAIGEVACTGLHGANRLASTSLLEGLVWGNRSAHAVMRSIKSLSEERREREQIAQKIPTWKTQGSGTADTALIQCDMQTIQNTMWYYVGLIRSEERLARAVRQLYKLQNEVETFYRQYCLSDALVGLRNALDTAIVIAVSARHNHTSRGCHYRIDAGMDTE